jgi:neutral trehalase
MDNQHMRAGHGKDNYCEGVDLNSYLVREASALAVLAGVLGEAEDQERFSGLARERAETIRRELWDDACGFFFDRDARDGSCIRVKHVGAFAALWAGVATENQATRIVHEHLLNENEFARPWPVPALAADEPCYRPGYDHGDHPRCCSWLAHTWVPSNYFTFQGLRRYGFDREAAELCRKTWELFLLHPFYEYYVTETGLGTGLRPFWGWSGLALFMPLEMQRGIDPTVLRTEHSAFATMHQAVADTLYRGNVL